MNRALRLAILFSVLFGIMYMVHQRVMLEAAEFIIGAPSDPAVDRAAWEAAGRGTGLLLQLFGAAALFTVLAVWLRGQSGRRERLTPVLEPITPLTNAVNDLKAREATHRRVSSQAVARMNEMRAVHATVLEGITSGALTVDAQGRIATCNRAACLILGWDGAPPLDRPVTELFRGCPPPGLTPDGGLAKAQRVEFPWRPPGREPRFLGLSISPIRTPAGPLTALLFSDLTEIKRLERQVSLRRHLSQLGEVSAGIAHEFRNNMGAVMGYARLLGHDLPEDGPAREVVEAMIAELTQMEGMIRDLLDFSRSSEPSLSRVDAAELVAEAIAIAAADFDLTPTWQVPSDLPPLMVDPVQVRGALVNLIRNACEAAGAGGEPKVSVQVGAEKGIIPEWLILRVCDNGPGVDPASVERIFLPFFTAREGGTGMGLAQVHKTVTAHGGEIQVDTALDVGARFTLRLPTIHRRPAEAP